MSTPSQRDGGLAPQATVEDVESERAVEEVQTSEAGKPGSKNEDVSTEETSTQSAPKSRAIQPAPSTATTQGPSVEACNLPVVNKSVSVEGNTAKPVPQSTTTQPVSVKAVAQGLSETGKSTSVDGDVSTRESRAQPGPANATAQTSASEASSQKAGSKLLPSQPKPSGTPHTSQIPPITSGATSRLTPKGSRQQGSTTTIDSPAKLSASSNTSRKEENKSAHSDEILSARTLVDHQENNLVKPVDMTSFFSSSAPVTDSPAPADGPFPYIKHRYVVPHY